MRRAFLSLLLLAACSRPEPPVATPSIILVSVDTLRSDHLPAYGYAKIATPHIDALRRDAVLYERAYSHAPLTLPSHLSMLTGLLPAEHGVRNNLGYRFDATKARTLAQILRERGYRTGAAVSSYVLRSETGIAEGFDVYEDTIPVRAGAATSENQRAGNETMEHARKFIEASGAQPFFLFLHLYEPHAPYEPSYDGEIEKSDAILGRLLETLRSRGLYDDALIVFTSDHGEALWEHGEDQHGILLYREVLQVPLLIKHPKNARAGETVREPFALREIFNVMTGAAPRDGAVYSETLYPRIHLGWSELRSLIEGRYHYIESSSPELYDLTNDPSEVRNIIGDERRVAADLRRKLSAFPAAIVAPERVDPEEARKLAALGYVGTVKARTGPLPNPREQIHTLRDLKAAFQLAAEHRHDEAIAALRALLAKNAALTDVSTRLGEVLLEAGREGEAVQVYQAAMARAERVSPDLALATAVALLKAGRNAEAVKHAELALSASPVEAREVLARAAIAEGRLDVAATHVRAAVEASGRSSSALLLMAELQRTAGQYGAAMQTLDEAERRAPFPLQGIDHTRADVFARTDRPDEAIAAYRREIERFPRHLQSYANLAVIYRILGRRSEAEQVLEEMVRKNPHAGARELAAKTREALRE
ncbi:MAG TPA: sulfatase-like hydrolase/transferase [Thermoanaerobaculia bacterium]|nr:sulfatase-like hydrolase/transferase [Thermoanaerobaculia bacterium]